MIVLMIVGNYAAQAQDMKGFGKFLAEPINAPGSYKVIPDPTGSAPFRKVHRFSINPGACNASAYGNSDCAFQSVRSQAFERGKKQPAEAWYGWYMYLPSAFPLGNTQSAGGTYSFAYWHNGSCPNLDVGIAENSTKLFLQTNIFGGPGDCVPEQRIILGDAARLRGAWHRFEVHIMWSKSGDGQAEIYIDGRRSGRLAGRNINRGPPSKNYFKFGIYLHGTKGTDLVRPATAYYAGLARASDRAGIQP